MGPAPARCAASETRRGDGVGVTQTRRLLVFAKRDVSVVLKRQKVARVGGLVVNRDLGTGVMGNKGGLVSTFVVEKEGFATTCTAINAHLWVAGVPWSRTPVARVRAANETQREATRQWRGCGRTKSTVVTMASRETLLVEPDCVRVAFVGPAPFPVIGRAAVLGGASLL